MNWPFVLFALIWNLEFGGELIEAEVVFSAEDKRKGLAGRTDLKKESGMLFVYEKEEMLSFWMKGMQIPISIAFFDKERKLINYHLMPLPKSGSSLIYYRSLRPAKYALELSFDWFQTHFVQANDQFVIVNR